MYRGTVQLKPELTGRTGLTLCTQDLPLETVQAILDILVQSGLVLPESRIEPTDSGITQVRTGEPHPAPAGAG